MPRCSCAVSTKMTSDVKHIFSHPKHTTYLSYLTKVYEHVHVYACSDVDILTVAEMHEMSFSLHSFGLRKIHILEWPREI